MVFVMSLRPQREGFLVDVVARCPETQDVEAPKNIDMGL